MSRRSVFERIGKVLGRDQDGSADWQRWRGSRACDTHAAVSWGSVADLIAWILVFPEIYPPTRLPQRLPPGHLHHDFSAMAATTRAWPRLPSVTTALAELPPWTWTWKIQLGAGVVLNHPRSPLPDTGSHLQDLQGRLQADGDLRG